MRFVCFILLIAVTGAAGAAAASPGDLLHIEHHPDEAALAARSRAILEDALREFAPRLPPGNAPIRLIIAHTFNEFMQHAGRFALGNVNGIAYPERGLIIVKSPRLRARGDYAGTLRHELVHILLHRNTGTDTLPRWLNEGIAMSLANEYYWASMITVAQMFVRGRIIEYRYLDTAFLRPGEEMVFGDAYAQALSMTRYMRKWLGEDLFWRVVIATREMSFGDALRTIAGKTPGDLWAGYRRSLWLTASFGIMASGSFFTPAAFLLIAAYIRRRQKDKKIYRRWAAEDAEDAATGITVFSWDEVTEDPDAWKQGGEEEKEP